MNTKNLLAVTAFALCAAVAFAAESKDPAKAAQKKAEAVDMSESIYRHFGEDLKDVRKQKGKVVIVNCQKSAKAEWMKSAAGQIDGDVRIAIEVADGAFDLKKPAVQGEASIFVVDDPSLPMTLLAREEKWGLVNVAALAADKPKTLTLLSRANKLTTRLITDILGGNNCLQVNFSAMKPVYSLKDLDAMEGHAIAPMSLTQMMYSLPKLGLSPVMMTTYQDACAEGWAPTPTNDIQRTIWNEVKNPETRFKKDLPDLKKNK